LFFWLWRKQFSFDFDLIEVVNGYELGSADLPWKNLRRYFDLLRLGLPSFHLDLAAEDRAPVLVFCHGHAAFDADTNALRGSWGIRREEPLEKRHSGSPGFGVKTLSLRNEPFPGYSSPRSDWPRRKHWLDQRIRQRVGTAVDFSHLRSTYG